MKTVSTLPEGYQETSTVDLQKHTALELFLNVLTLLMGALLVAPVNRFVPLSECFRQDGQVMRWLVFFGCILTCSIVSELIHVAALKLCGVKQIRFSFKGGNYFAHSEEYLGRTPYILVSLLPALLNITVLFAACLTVPTNWFWSVYATLVIAVLCEVSSMFFLGEVLLAPANSLIRQRDNGLTVYAPVPSSSGDALQ